MFILLLTFRPVLQLACLLLEPKVLEMKSILLTLEEKLPIPAMNHTARQVIISGTQVLIYNLLVMGIVNEAKFLDSQKVPFRDIAKINNRWNYVHDRQVLWVTLKRKS